MNVRFGEMGIGCQEIAHGVPIGDAAYQHAHRYARAPDTKDSMVDAGVDDDAFTPVCG
jgi:hypothetical protein